MVLKFPVSEWFESSGNQAAEFNEALRDGIAGFTCSLWQQFPDFIVNGKNPASSFARGFLNQACSPIQPPVPFPNPGFTGGQCPGVLYNVDVNVILYNTSTCTISTNATPTLQVTGPIQGIEKVVVIPDASTSDCNAATTYIVDRVNLILQGTGDSAQIGSNLPDGRGVPDPPLSSATIVNISRVDGLPDDCGDPVPSYPPVVPTLVDLQTTINITNLDLVDLELNLQFNQINDNFNFPIGFKLEGTNVVVDVEGITIYGDPYSTSPNAPNDSPPPGTDGGKDGEGNDYVVVFTDQVYPVTSDYSQPQTVEQEIEYLVCNEGVIETVIEVISAVLPLDPITEIILLILGQIITELCEMEEQQAEVGLPEYYPVLPGTERPAIVYLYKEVINGVKQKPTYSSTVSNPSASAVAGIDTIVVPNKTMGRYVCSVTLSDGSRIRASGDTEMAADTNFNFLVNQVDPPLIPPDLNDLKVTTFYPRLQVLTVVCTQIEYYPDGKAAGVSPAIRRFIST